MASVIQGAYLTLFTTVSRDSTHGLFSCVPTARRIYNINGETQEGASYSVYARPSYQHINDEISSYTFREFPLLGRDWVYQERLLSHRILHFGSSELMWECRELTTCEGLCPSNSTSKLVRRLKVHDRALLAAASSRTLWERWADVVEEYTSLTLTKPSDILLALAELASQMAPLRKGRFLAGLWEKSLISDLCWSKDGISNIDRPTCHTEWLAPTWSWASFPHKRILMQREDKIKEYCASVRGIECAPESLKVTGKLLSGIIILEAPLVPITIMYDWDLLKLMVLAQETELIDALISTFEKNLGIWQPSKGPQRRVGGTLWPDFNYISNNFDECRKFRAKAFCLKLLISGREDSIIHWLILEFFEKDNIYERIGLFKQDLRDVDNYVRVGRRFKEPIMPTIVRIR